MFFLLVLQTAMYAASVLYGTAIDAIFLASSLAVVCAWLPRVFYALVSEPAAWISAHLYPEDSASLQLMDDVAAKVRLRTWQGSVASATILLGVFCFGPDLAGQAASGAFSWPGLLDVERRFVLLAAGSFGAVLVGMVDLRMQQQSGRFRIHNRMAKVRAAWGNEQSRRSHSR